MTAGISFRAHMTLEELHQLSAHPVEVEALGDDTQKTQDLVN